MRRLHRADLPLTTRLSLHQESLKVDDDTVARERWATFRRSARCAPVEQALEAMAGSRKRCAYCSDSIGSDIDHFIPISIDHTHTFRWLNLLWVCTPCNRKKGARFPRDTLGNPLLIDPTRVDPWSRLTLETATGFIAPRFYDGSFDRSGESTLAILETINDEAVAEGRLRIARRLIRSFDSLIATACGEPAMADVLRCAREDDMGIARWFGVWDGRNEPSTAHIREHYPRFWRRYLRVCSS